MKEIKVLGPGCKRCVQTAELITTKARDMGVDVQVEKVTDIAVIMGYGVMSTPGVVVDGKVVHAGGLPKPDAIENWLAS